MNKKLLTVPMIAFGGTYEVEKGKATQTRKPNETTPQKVEDKPKTTEKK